MLFDYVLPATEYRWENGDGCKLLPTHSRNSPFLGTTPAEVLERPVLYPIVEIIGLACYCKVYGRAAHGDSTHRWGL